jgi:uncharacterized protein YjgD (DUF1641 family)
MAMAVEFREFTPKNSRDDLIRKVQNAPEAHAEALLAAYELLQRMHDKGLIDVANGLLSAGDTVVDRVVDVASSKPAVTALRIALMFSNLLSTLDPDAVSAVLAPKEKEPPSLWQIAKQAMGKDARAGLAASIGLLKVLGAALTRQRVP